jgi:hypothetical protein
MSNARKAFRKGMEVKVSKTEASPISIMMRGIVVSTDWPFVEVQINGETESRCFFRNDVFPINYYTC